MSRFVATRNPAAGRAFVERYGHDVTHRFEIGGFTFAQQAAPRAAAVVDGEVVVLCDGEVYGGEVYGDLAESGPAGIVLRGYRQHGEDFARRLDGQFAAAVYDFGRRRVVLATDPFATKRLFVNGSEAASFLCDLDGGERLPANTLRVADLDGKTLRTSIAAPFDFDHQHKQTYDDWIAAFERAVARRAVDGCYLPLSAGYDSGALDAALDALGIEYKTFSFAGGENAALLHRRVRRGEILHMDPETFAERKAFLSRHPEAASFEVEIVKKDGRLETYDPLEDGASCGLALIHGRARAEGRRVFLTGTGGDETVAGLDQWPEVLRPWPDFGARWGAAYQGKEEFVAGVFGVEVRYPFFDRALVQEFLWLSVELKGRCYKAPLDEYLTRKGYPFEKNVKTGFIPLAAPR